MKKVSKEKMMKKLGNLLEVSPLWSVTGRSQSPNQIKVRFSCGSAFFSYGTLIAVYASGQLYLTAYHDYSATTIRYTNLFTNMNTKARREGLQSGEILYIE